MSFSSFIQWYHSHVDPIWPDGMFKIQVNTHLMFDTNVRPFYRPVSALIKHELCYTSIFYSKEGKNKVIVITIIIIIICDHSMTQR